MQIYDKKPDFKPSEELFWTLPYPQSAKNAYIRSDFIPCPHQCR